MKVELIIDSHVTFETDRLKRQSKKCFVELQKKFTYSNPEHYKLRNMNYSTRGVPHKLKSYTEKGNKISFSRGGIAKIKKILRKHGHKVIIRDERLTLPPVNFHSKIVLRDEQKAPVRLLVKKQQGIIRGPCASGKTVMVLQAIAEVGQPTIVIVWEKTHQIHWLKETLEFFGIDESEIGGCGGIFKKPKFGKINLCMQQSLLNEKNLKFFAERVGCVAGDEIQRYGAKTYQETINEFPAKHRFGCSANERRKDGKHFFIYDGFGKVLHEVPDENVGGRRPAKVTLIPTRFTSEDYAVESNHPKVVTEMLEDANRNKLITRAVKRSLKKKKFVLILTERKAHALFLYFYFKKYRTSLLLGATTPKNIRESGWPKKWKKFMSTFDNDAEFERIKTVGPERELDLTIATQKGFVGLSVKTYDHGYVVTPTGINMELFNQQKGRVERDHDEKLEKRFGVKATPRVFYMWDARIEKFQKAGNRIMKTYPGSKILRLKAKGKK